MSQTVMQKFKRRHNERILFLHEITSFDLLNFTLYCGKINGYFVNKQKYQTSSRKNMSQGFCNLRDATEDSL